MVHFIRAVCRLEIPLIRDWESVFADLSEDSGENGYFEAFYAEEKSFWMLTKRRSPIIFNIHIPEITGQVEGDKLKLCAKIARLSKMVELVIFIPVIMMFVVTAILFAVTGIAALHNIMFFLVLILIIQHMYRNFCFWWEVGPAIERIQNIINHKTNEDF